VWDDRAYSRRMKLFAIGFTQKSAEEFFALLRNAGVKRVLDIRLNNRSQLAGFSKSEDLEYFLRALDGIGYRHVLEMAPTQPLLDKARKAKGTWDGFEKQFLALMKQRRVEKSVDRKELADACLLCSEHEPDHCHRRLVAEYLQRAFPDIEIVHLR
jgi:uncharacterized protein (DUF488 family)